jgi:hypothetical protein
MDKAPAVGARVKLKPGHHFYPASGTVEHVWPGRGAEPESAWAVTMAVDPPLPKNWVFGNSNTFCPDVAEIEMEGR